MKLSFKIYELTPVMFPFMNKYICARNHNLIQCPKPYRDIYAFYRRGGSPVWLAAQNHDEKIGGPKIFNLQIFGDTILVVI